MMINQTEITVIFFIIIVFTISNIYETFSKCYSKSNRYINSKTLKTIDIIIIIILTLILLILKFII